MKHVYFVKCSPLEKCLLPNCLTHTCFYGSLHLLIVFVSICTHSTNCTNLLSKFYLIHLSKDFMILASCFATCYWINPSSSEFKCIIFQSAHVTLRYHVGTAAFGSAFTAVFQFLSPIMNCIQTQFESMVKSKDPTNIWASIPFFKR